MYMAKLTAVRVLSKDRHIGAHRISADSHSTVTRTAAFDSAAVDVACSIFIFGVGASFAPRMYADPSAVMMMNAFDSLNSIRGSDVMNVSVDLDSVPFAVRVVSVVACADVCGISVLSSPMNGVIPMAACSRR